MGDFVNWYHKAWRFKKMGSTTFDEDIHWVNVFFNIQRKIHFTVGLSISPRSIDFDFGLLVFKIHGIIFIKNILEE